MKMKTLGRTGLEVTENSFGALPIQRISDEDAVDLLRYAYESGINFYDTARFYTDVFTVHATFLIKQPCILDDRRQGMS